MIAQLAHGVLAHDRRSLAKAITLLESVLPTDRDQAARLLDVLLPRAGNSIRIGISGPPGVGKSTLIEALGAVILKDGRRLAVLAVDPTSSVSKGSILGDRVRMETLSREENAFIRPSASGQSLGGVARHTREAIIACEAGGYDVVVVETVGVGQSETTVASMVDLFLILQHPNAGDEIQGMKKGLLELGDLVAVTKADGDLMPCARLAKSQLELTLHMARGESAPKVLTISSIHKTGIDELWREIKAFTDQRQGNGSFHEKRRAQALSWFHDELSSLLLDWVSCNANRTEVLRAAEEKVRSGKIPASIAAAQVITALLGP